MQDTKVKTKALDKSNCAAARLGGKEAGVKAASLRTETGYEAGDADELVPHNEVPVSASQVKPGVVLRKSHPLPGKTCAASRQSQGRSHGNQNIVCQPTTPKWRQIVEHLKQQFSMWDK